MDRHAGLAPSVVAPAALLLYAFQVVIEGGVCEIPASIQYKSELHKRLQQYRMGK